VVLVGHELETSDDIADGGKVCAALWWQARRESISCTVIGVSAEGLFEMVKKKMEQAEIDPHLVDAGEVEKFNRLASEWWDPQGKMKPLHKFNPVRLTYLRDTLAAHFERDIMAPEPFKGLTLLDIGCGGGLLSEPLARLGFTVTGIDPAGNNVDVAKVHAEKSGVQVTYRKETAEALVAEKASFDVVLAMEVIEHVPDVQAFASTATSLVGSGGIFVGATLNRTKRSFALAILGAEYILRWLPVGTHDWNKFVTPDEFTDAIEAGDLRVFERKGVVFNPFTDRWSLADDLAVNYMVAAK
jgi:2-polyprenyl-6-hydroxyphenyl methylase / 3-demethylubiquinone-9 3-methyltransferase